MLVEKWDGDRGELGVEFKVGVKKTVLLTVGCDCVGLVVGFREDVGKSSTRID